MEKKLYCQFDESNGHSDLIDDDLSNISELIKREYESVKMQGLTDVKVIISFVWMTEEEFNELPETDY